MRIIKHCILALVATSFQDVIVRSEDLLVDPPIDLVANDAYDSVNVRFNKFGLLDEAYRPYLPFGKDEYPISNNDTIVDMLKTKTDAISVVHERDYEIKLNVAELIGNVGGFPDHPTSDLNAPYWDELNKVIDMRVRTVNYLNQRAKNHISDVMQLPLRWENYTMDDLAEAVHDEYPGLHQSEFLADLVGAKKYGPISFDHNIIPRRSTAQFLRGIVMLSDINTWSIGKVGPHNFASKWYAGRARPEEVVWKILDGSLAAPQQTVSKIQNYPTTLSKPEEFTNYPEGAPRHPSWPAMHSAASNISYWLRIVMNLTPRQLCEAKKVDYAVAYARTIAGVHFEDDNIDGLNMGQIIIEKTIPTHLKKKYKAVKKTVKRKAKKMRFEWNDYDPLAPCN